MAQLRGLVPTDMDKFFPAFSNPPKNYIPSMYGLFGATVQKYYATFILGCSLPKLRLLGTPADWQLLVDTITNLLQIVAKLESIEVPTEPEPKKEASPYDNYSNGFDGLKSAGSYEFKYLLKCQRKAQEFVANLDNPSYWSTFVYTDRCGSGGEQGVRGHIMAFLPVHEMTTYALRKTISRYPYEDEFGGKYNFISGIMYSELDSDGILVPQYHCGNTMWKLQTQPLPSEEKEHMKLTLRALEILDKYDLNNVYAETERRTYDPETGGNKVTKVNVPDCVWFKKPARDNRYHYYYNDGVEKKLAEDKFHLTPELRASVLSLDDVKYLCEHMPTIYNHLVATKGLDWSFFMKCLYTFNLEVMKASIEAYFSHPFLLSYETNYYRHQIATPEALLERIISVLPTQTYLDRVLQTELTEGFLLAFSAHKDKIKTVLAEQIYRQVNYQLADIVNYSKQLTDFYSLPPVDLYELINRRKRESEEALKKAGY